MIITENNERQNATELSHKAEISTKVVIQELSITKIPMHRNDSSNQERPEGLAVGGQGISKIYRLEIFTAQSIRIIFVPPP